MSDTQPGYLSRQEIASQPEAWEAIISLVTGQADTVQSIFRGVEEVIFAGCGSALNSSLCGAPTLQALAGIPARAVPAAEVYLFPESVLNEGRQTLAVLTSRSGQTTEVLHALAYLKERGIHTLGITCTEGSPLALETDLSFVLSSATEQAVITTRSLTGMILAKQLIAAVVAGDEVYLNELKRLPAACERLMPAYHDLGQAIGQNTALGRYAFLGSGPFFGLAHEAQLKVKETVLLPVDSYPALDFRHGPQSTVDGEMLVALLMSDSGREEELHLIQDMKALGGVTWVLCDRADEAVRAHADHVLETGSGLSDYARGVLYMPAVQYMAFYRSLSRGLNPDSPPNLAYYIDISK